MRRVFLNHKLLEYVVPLLEHKSRRRSTESPQPTIIINIIIILITRCLPACLPVSCLISCRQPLSYSAASCSTSRKQVRVMKLSKDGEEV
jgi:hypothetical protein